MSHTPGPWQLVKEGVEFSFKDEYQQNIMTMQAGRYGSLPHEADANAKLVAAAPDMLRVLKDMVYGQTHMITPMGLTSFKAAADLIDLIEGDDNE